MRNLIKWPPLNHRSNKTSSCPQTDPITKPIIIDNDMLSDVEDVAALAVANVLRDCGAEGLRVVLINANSVRILGCECKPSSKAKGEKFRSVVRRTVILASH